MILPDGTLIKLPDDGTQLKLSYHRLVNIDDHTTRTLESNTVIKLPQNTFVVCADGRKVLLDGEAEAILPDGKPRPALYEEIFSKTCYDPSELLVATPYPVKDLDFSPEGAYAIYNWELFYHVPFTIGMHLSKNQRFEEAQRWFHLIFDPTDDSNGSTPERFWKVKPFQTSDVRQIEEILVNLATGEDR